MTAAAKQAYKFPESGEIRASLLDLLLEGCFRWSNGEERLAESRPVSLS